MTTNEERFREFASDEVITHSRVNDIRLRSGRTLALITLDNDRDYKRPNTLGPATMWELEGVLDDLTRRAKAGEIDAVGITGKQYIFAAGADLSKIGALENRELGYMMANLGHRVLGKLDERELGVPSFTFYNGLALGGGVEVGLNSTYRTIDESVAAFGLPEVFLGILPGWGGAYLLPNLIGIEGALKVIIENPLKNNRMLKAREAFELGIADAMFSSADFLEESLKWADGVLSGEIKVKRPNEPGKIERLTKWDIACGIARKSLEDKIGTVPRAPYRALELIRAAKKASKAEAFAAEDEALADLLSGDQFRASIYAFDLVQKRAKRPAGAPDKELAHRITKVGVIGAGLMASQFATLFVRRLKVPVLISDLDQARVDKGIEYIHGELAKLHEKGRLSSDDFNQMKALVTGTTNRADYADCDFVIEAVFEELKVKQDVFGDVEQYISEECVLATNTSSLSVEEIGAELKHPERLVGFHFFNPVAVMPLIEVVKTPQTNDATLATAMETAKKLRKTAVITRDTPGFVVNRVLAKVLGEAMHAAEIGTPLEVIDHSLDPFGLPMSPIELLELVGLKVGAHVLDTHHAAFPDRFFDSPALHELAEHGKLTERDGKGRVKGYDKGAERILAKHAKAQDAKPYTAEELRERVEVGLADEVKRMLDDRVVAAAEDIDLCLIMGAGYPFQMGGLTPYLDRSGASEKAFGDTFHHPMIVGVA